VKARLAAVVPAAGFSRRMGREKILLPFGRSTVLETIFETLEAAGVTQRVAVLRPDQAEAADLARRAGARVIVNPRPEEPMLLSIRLGLDSLAGQADAVFIWPADHPAVSLAAIELLAASADPARALLPTHRGRRGHPALVGKDLLPEIASIRPEEGLRRLWRIRTDAVLEVPVEDPGVLRNIDTPSDYEKAIAEEKKRKGAQEKGS